MTAVPIVYAISRMGIGGTPQHLLEVLGHLDRALFHPALYCLRAEPGDRFLTRARELGVEVIDGGVEATLRGPRAIRPLLRLAGELRRRRIMLVHSYLFHANFLGTMAARLARVPVAVVSKRSLDVYPRAVDRWTCRLGNGLADSVCVNAEAVKRHVHQAEQCSLDKIEVIPNGIDFDRVAGGLPGPGGGLEALRRPVVGTVGRLATKKGQTDLLEAAPLVLARYPEASFLIIGDGPLRQILERRARDLGVEGRVQFLGAVTDGARMLSQMDVFVLPSHMEGMSNSLIEAMAAGLPVVATDVGGNGEVVVDGETGFLVPARNPACLAEAILLLLKDRERACTMAVAGRARAAEHFSVRAMVGRLTSFYRRLLSARGIAVG